MSRPNAGTKGVPRLDRENQILAIASSEFGSQGFAATSVSEIAMKAGISKPLIYNYFGSKDGLYEACLDRGGAMLAEEIERIARGDSIGIERGMRTLAGMFSLLERQRYLWRLFFDVTAPRTGSIAAAKASYADRIDKIAHEGVAELMTLAGNRNELDTSAMTAVWLGIVDSLMNWWVEHPDETAAQMIERCSRLLTALFGDPGPLV